MWCQLNGDLTVINFRHVTIHVLSCKCCKMYDESHKRIKSVVVTHLFCNIFRYIFWQLCVGTVVATVLDVLCRNSVPITCGRCTVLRGKRENFHSKT